MGALDEAVVARLKAAAIEPIAVTIWLAGEMPPPPKRSEAQGTPITPEEVDRYLAVVDAERGERIVTILAPVLERVRALATDPAIDRIYIDPKHRSELAVAKQTIRADFVQQAGPSGRGVRFSMVEVDAGIVEPDSLLLRPVVRDALGVCLNTVSDHDTSVASAIVARRFTLWGVNAGEEGVAPNVELRSGGSCSGPGNELQAAATRAADRQKPDLVAPVADLTLVVGGPANTRVWSRTSFAAPLMTAATALPLERHERLAM